MKTRDPGRLASVGLYPALLAMSCWSCAETGPSILSTAPSIATAATTGADVRMVWRNLELHPIGQPIVIDGIAVGIVVDQRELFVVGIDPASGTLRWHQRLSPGAVGSWLPAGVTKVGTRIAYLRPARPDSSYAYTELVVADVHTGSDLAKSPPALFFSEVMPCADGKAACALAQDPREDRGELVRLDIATGAYRSDSHHIPAFTRFLDGSGLVDLGDRPGNTLGLLRGGKLQWHAPLASAFPRKFSTDHGWNWRLYADEHVFVGTVFGPSGHDGDRRTRDLAVAPAMAAVSEATGQVLWRERGARLHCNLAAGSYPVRCRSKGKVTWETDKPTRFEGLDVTVEGFELATGKTTWSVHAGAVEALAFGDTHPAIAGRTQVVLHRADGPLLLDYATGASEVPTPGATFWCMADVRYQVRPMSSSQRYVEDSRRPGGELAFVCDARGKPATALPSAAATMAAGAQVGDYAVLATRDGFVGFQAK